MTLMRGPLIEQPKEQQALVSVQHPRGSFLRYTGLILGTVVGGYLGYEFTDSARYFSRAGGFEFVASQHPTLTLGVNAVIGGVFGRSFGAGLQEILGSFQSYFGEKKDEMFGRRNRNGR